MAQNETVYLEKSYVHPTLYLTEGLWISATAPDRVPLTPLPGGGGPGYGGWGLDAGRPRGTGGPSRFVHDKGWRTVFGEEMRAVDGIYAEEHAATLQQLPEQIEAERGNLRQQANTGAGTPSQAVELHQQLVTANLQQKRAEYLQTVPVATGFYGAVPFYKRYDSFASRLHDDGAFEQTRSGEEWGRRIWETYNASVDAAYRLHVAAQKYQALANDLPELARQADQAELEQPGADLPRAIERRVKQIQLEQQICFDCLPSFIQHQVVQFATVQETDTLPQRLTAYANAANALIGAKQAEVPAFSEANPSIVGPLSKPQVEALQHLVDDQAAGRAGRLWADYHRALALTESIRYLQTFSSAMGNLTHRAAEVEQLHVRYVAEQAAALEAARQQAEAERLAAEAERQRLEAERRNISYIHDARVASSLPAITPIGPATFAITEVASTALLEAIRAAVARMATATLASAPQFLVTVLAAAWPSSLGNAERRYLISTPLSSLSPPGGPDLAALAIASASVDVPYLLAGSDDENELELYVVPGGKPVGVRAATFDTERQVYTLALDNPQRILTWTPTSAPGG